MKKIIYLFIALISFKSFSQTNDALKLCVAIQANNFSTDSEAQDAIDKILSVIGTSQKPVLQACSNINNAVAVAYKGQRYILYDRDFMNSLTKGNNKYWSNMFILAHEVGHHINGHSLDVMLYSKDVINPKSLFTKRKQELEADEFAGFVLAKLGATLKQTSEVLLNLPSISNENTSTHPSRDKRITSVRIGFKKGYIKKETKTVYVIDVIGEYERSDSYAKYGKWYREQNDDVFEGKSWSAVTSGQLKGRNDYFSKAPIIKIKKGELVQKTGHVTYQIYYFYLEGSMFENLPSSLEPENRSSRVPGELLILDSKNEKIFQETIWISTVSDKEGFNKINNNSYYRAKWTNSIVKELKKGSKLLIRLNDYVKKNTDQEIKEEVIEVKGAYFEYSLSGSSKALAD